MPSKNAIFRPFGVESSKSLPLELKVRHHHLAINAFMDRLGIVTESPGMNLSPPRLRYLVVNVNDALPIVVQGGQALHVHAGGYGDGVPTSRPILSGD